MKKQVTRIVVIVLTMVAVLLIVPEFTPPVSAVKYGDVAGVPKDFWPVYTPYENAVAAGDSKDITLTGEKIINYWLNGGKPEDRASEWTASLTSHGYEINQVWVVSQNVARHYEKLGDVTNAVRVYRISLAFVDAYKALIPHIGGNPDDMEFARTLIQNKIAAYDVKIDVYAEMRDGSGDTSYHNARNEPKNGVYFGDPPGPDAAMDLAKKPSSTVIYVLFESEDLKSRVEYDIKTNEKLYGFKLTDYSAIEIAWNFRGEGSTLKSVPQQGAKVTEAASYLKSLGVPILLRVGAEMNVWSNRADPAEFIAAFRFVADIMHKEAPNVALVWSVNSVSAQGNNYEMFYPGDDAVDWVGITLYTTKYFLGDPNTSDTTASIYGTGKYANPISFMKNLVDMYGSKKPIMISEGGVSLHNVSNKEDLTTWALPRIRQMYSYIPMLFPQVKAMYWFNVRDDDTRQRYDFAASPASKALYGQLTAHDYFIGKGETGSPVTFKKLGTATMPADEATLCVYAPFFTMDNVAVQYMLDGRSIGQSADVPYRQKLNLSGEADGTHKLTIVVSSEGKALKTVEYGLSKSGSLIAVSASATPTVSVPTAKPASASVIVNGETKSFGAYDINGNNYFKLRDLAFVLSGTQKQFEVGWDSAKNAITLTSKKPYTKTGGEMAANTPGNKPAKPTSAQVYLDGVKTAFTAYEIDGNNYFKLRDIGEAFDFGVDWDGTRNTIVIDTGKQYTQQ